MTNDLKNITSDDIALENIHSVEVLMLVGTHCSFCAPMLKIVSEMVKQGDFVSLHVVNIEQDHTLAAELGVRGVPWLRIGPFELAGVRTKEEIKLWLDRAKSDDGITLYLEEILAEGNVSTAIIFVKRYPKALDNVIDLVMNAEGKINVRLGAGVIIEDMAESDEFKVVIPRLVDALSDKDARVRGDACHYLSLTKDVQYLPLMELLLSDVSEEVKEIAQDSIDDLKTVNNG